MPWVNILGARLLGSSLVFALHLDCQVVGINFENFGENIKLCKWIRCVSKAPESH